MKSVKEESCVAWKSLFPVINYKHKWFTGISVIILLLIDPCLFQVLVPYDRPGESAHKQEVELAAGINHIPRTQH